MDPVRVFSQICGTVAPGFEPVREAFARNFSLGLEVGATVTVILDGTAVVDLWGGTVDCLGRVPLGRDALFNVWSISKAMTALCAALLVERRYLDYDACVSRYWPEFGRAGKETITVGQLLSHQAGLSGCAAPIVVEDLFDHAKIAFMLSRQQPFWPIGSGWGYHGMVYGHLVDELVRRTDGRTLGCFFGDEVARPLNIDAYLGLPASNECRFAPMVPPESLPSAPARPGTNAKAVAANGNPPVDAEWSNRRDWRRAGIGAAGGCGNSRGLAKLFGLLVGGGEIDGVRLLSPQTVRAATIERIRGISLTSGLPGAYAAGFALNLTGGMGPNPHSYGHAGFGGSLAFADPDRNLAFGYVMNRMRSNSAGQPDARSERVIKAVYEVVRH